MNISKYMRLRYDIENKVGVNCWGLYALVRYDVFGETGHRSYKDKTYTKEELVAEFTASIAAGNNGHYEVDTPIDYDLILLELKGTYHCGIYYKGKMLHANGTGKSGQVWYDELTEFKHWNRKYLRYDNKCN